MPSSDPSRLHRGAATASERRAADPGRRSSGGGVRAWIATAGFLFVLSGWSGLWRPICAQALPDFNGGEAQGWVVRQCGLGPRVPGSRAHGAWVAMVRSYLDSLGLPYEVQRFPHPGPSRADTLQGTNLRVTVRPGVRPRLLLGAHWDSRPWADREASPANRARPVPGANDGASGAAILLTLARMLAEDAPPLGVDLAFFDAEDLGREGHPEEYALGSRWMAEHWSGDPPNWVVVVDMVGSERTEIGREAWSWAQAPQLVDLLFGIAESKGYREWNREAQTAVFDDHLPFQALGVPSVLVIGFNDPFWHTLRDEPSATSARRLGRVGDVITTLIYGRFLTP